MRAPYSTSVLVVAISLVTACGADDLETLPDRVSDGLARVFEDPCADPAVTESRAIFSTELPLPYQVYFQATGDGVERYITPTGLVTLTPTEPVRVMFEAECRDGALHDLNAPETTHGPCTAQGFPVPLTTIADVTLVRGDREWMDTRGTAWVSTNDEEGCAARFAGELWLETETLVE